ncbi:MAG: toll/interleukin-1 receptor domain-containing protein, partial [Sulfurimicrobium sp.]|nr:toll/interleukin-1 receptor domain-containing protein [Sulfurimicrobium sp.]
MKIFISYASEERPIADELAVRLRTEGHTVFLDKDNLPEGEGYDAQIRAAIAACDLYLFLVSPLSIQPGRYTMTELKFAREQFPNPRG